MKSFRQKRKDLIEDMAVGMITDESMHKKNFDLGKLDILNELLDDDFYDDLIDTLTTGEQYE